MTFKFVHMADIHLDTPFQSSNGRLRAYLRDSIRDAFKASVDIALSRSVHAVLIAGDLFDNDSLSFKSEKFLLSQLQRLSEAKIEVFYAPGNHDPYSSINRMGISWPQGFHIFDTHEPASLPVIDKNGEKAAVIVGTGHEGIREMRNLAAGFPEASGSVPHVGLLHTFLTGSKDSEVHDRYAPCSLSDLTQKGYAYWALGHVHNREEISKDPYIVYPGNIIGRNTTEVGIKGVYYVEIDNFNNVKTEFCNVSPVCWATIEVNNLVDANNLLSLEGKIHSKVSEEIVRFNYSGQLILKIILKGPCPYYKKLSDNDDLEELADSLRTSLNIEFLSIGTNITRPVEPGNFKGEPHVLGTALSILDKLYEDDELLLKLSPTELAGCKAYRDPEEKVKYLRCLLDGLDLEIAARLLKEDSR